MPLQLNRLVRSLDFENQTLSRDELTQIGQHTPLVGLSFKNCPLTDDDVACFCQLPRLVNLGLHDSAITDRALAHLAQLPSLKLLLISGARLNGEGFAHFANHPKLECVWAERTDLNDDALHHLARIAKLSTLRIVQTPVTFEGLMRVAHNPRLQPIADGRFTAEQMAAFEQAQRDAARKKPANHQTLPASERAAAQQVLHDFFAAMNDWERAAHQLSAARAAQNRWLTPQEDETLQQQCRALFSRYCVEKPRPGFRPDALSWQDPPQYSRCELVDAEPVTRNKLYLYVNSFFGHSDMTTALRFILLKKDGAWKIDECQWNHGGWKKHGL